MRDDVDDDKAELRRVQNREQVKRTQMIVKRNVSVQMALTVRIACPGIWAGSLMIMGPMHEQMSFKIEMLKGQDRESRSSRRSARSRRLKSHSDHCAWSKISNDGMSTGMQVPKFGRNRRRR